MTKLDHPKLRPSALGHWLLALAWLSCVNAFLVNITVDDYYRDPVTDTTWVKYTPYDAWKLSVETVCDTCTAHPDPHNAYFDTWHEGVSDVGGGPVMYASFDFEGVAVYVYCIIPRSNSSPNGNVDMRFVLDGQEVGTYNRRPNGTDTYEYHVPVYVNTSLPAGNHTIELHNGKLGGFQSTVLLDYIRYTRDTSVEPLPSTLTAPVGPTVTVGPAATVGPTSAASNGTLSGTGRVPIIAVSVVCALFAMFIVGMCATRGPRMWAALKRRWQGLPPSAQYLQSVGADGERGQSGWVAGAPASAGTGAVSPTRPVERTSRTSRNASEAGDAPQAGPGPSTEAGRQGHARTLDVEEVAR